MKKAFFLALFSTLALSACGGGSHNGQGAGHDGPAGVGTQPITPSTPPDAHPGREATQGATQSHALMCGSSPTVAVSEDTQDSRLQCPDEMAKPVPGEGLCFIDDSVTPVYESEPPASGPIFTYYDYQWYEHKEVVPRAVWVHNLAHGFVAFIYNCPTGCEAELNAMRSVMHDMAGNPMIMTPDPLLKNTRFALVSWTWVYAFDTPDQDAMKCFVQRHVDHGVPH